MHMIRTLTGSPRDLLDPSTRKINFNDEAHIRTVATWVRRAWPAIPASAVTEADDMKTARVFGEFCQKYQEGGESKVEDIPLDPDTRSVRTPWREQIYFAYNHIFYDVAKFLEEAAGGVGHFHPPRHEVFAVDFPAQGGRGGLDAGGDGVVGGAHPARSDGSGAEGGLRSDGHGPVTKMKWPTNILLIPAYLAPGVKVRVTIADRPKQDGAVDEGPAPDDEVVGTWDGTNNMEVWYLRAGVEIGLEVDGKGLGHVDGENEGKGEIGGNDHGEGNRKGEIGGKSDDSTKHPGKADGVAAVFVVGVLCTVIHQAPAGV